ncbi:ferric reduction oxidase 4-like [Impatiens glandulifera]|uniref:ferric reduction oxidase 4-like n=1 Tax=Impatiens glandulifera TaxID=253017 RepID=UPI001FB06BEE|nr:ferric reduction oxidase 4-like [Impatiens glandulifera]
MGSLTSILRMMFLIVFIGWLFIWIIIPTSTYKYSWTPNLTKKIGSSTFFGSQGTNLLLLSFPVMLMAALGCVYLHFEKKKKIGRDLTGMQRPDFLRRPVHISSTLGIVTMTELVFVAMFFALLIWSLANYLHISFGHLTMYSPPGEKTWKTKFRSVSLRLGYIGNICWAFLFFPVTRGSSILPMIGLTSESSIKYHIWLGHVSNLLFTLHTIGFIVYWGITNQMSQMVDWDKTYVSNVAGWIAMLFGWAIWVTSFPSIRRKAFELFFYTHHLYLLYIVFYMLHVGGPYLFMILPGIFLFFIDRYLRFLQSQKRARLVSARLLPCGVVELNLSKCLDLHYNPTSIMFIHVPSISRLQWHPFTIISSGNLELDRISVLIKSLGTWSQKLYQELSSSSKTHLEVHVEGPYGPVSPDLLRRDSLVMVSGGSGIAPFISIIREVIHLSTQPGSHIPKMLLICVFKNSMDLTMLDLLLPASSVISPEILSKLELKIEAYVTKDIEEQPKPNRDLIRSIWFKPNPNDSLVTAALGSNSWLWLGAIITTSFVMFLLLLGIVTRRLIYPIEHNKQVYNFSGKVLWDMFLACVGVFIGTSAIFLWQKKEISRTEGQVQNVELQTPTASPGLQFHGGETTELESLPGNSLVQDIAVHHGARPNLKSKYLYNYILTSILRMMFFIVFIGWLFIWIIIPTGTYKYSWTPNLKVKIGSSTFFGSQGTNLLLLSFPVMLMAALGCVYLHFEKKKNISRDLTRMQRPDYLRRPVHISSTLGIVTMTELLFVTMFFALLIWSLANYLHIGFGHLTMHSPRGEKIWKTKFRSVSLRLGYIGNICWAFLFFPVTRGSSILPMIGLTSESSIKYHIWLGHVSNLLFTLHTIGFIVYWGITNQMSQMVDWDKTYVSNVAGWIAMLFGWAIWVTSFPSIRRKAFELFFYTHHLYLLYIVFYMLHVGGPYLFMILPGIFLFFIDRYLRFLQSQKRARLVSARLLPCGVVELNLSKCLDLHYNPTSIMFIHVPSISRLQWHPFTIISSGNLELDRISVVIKSLGTWSQKLYQELSSSSKTNLEVHVEGPYGPVSPDLLRRDSLVMVSGGSGIAPFISIIREVIHLSTQPGSHIPKMLLICVFKDSMDLTMLDLLLPASSVISPEILSKLELKIEAYVTKDIEEHPKPNRDLIRSIWFKPNPNDSLVTASLGSNSWLWLGAIITTSFVMFLLLLGIVTRRLIYPIEHNQQVYNFSGKVLWDMFLACVGVFIGTSAIFLWQKDEISRTEGQVQNVELQTPTASPGLQFHGGETTELESLPGNSVVKDIAVHHGARPNLKKILFDCKGSDVGVMVCGPKEMRHEVARICSSGLAENLHFEAISFNW